VAARAGTGPLGRHRRPDLDPGRVHRRVGILGRRGLQRAGMADAQDRGDQGPAAACSAGVKRAAAHPLVAAALATEDMSESYACTLCQWTDRLPGECRQAADEILVSAAAAGMDLRDLAGLFAEIYERSRPQEPDEDPGPAFGDPGGPAGDHLRRRRGDVGGSDAAVRGGGGRGAGRAGRPRPGRWTPGPRRSGITTRGRGDAPAAKMRRDLRHINTAFKGAPSGPQADWP